MSGYLLGPPVVALKAYPKYVKQSTTYNMLAVCVSFQFLEKCPNKL